jgi:hypothetical protein
MIIHDKQKDIYYEDEIDISDRLRGLKKALENGSFYVCKIVGNRLVDDRPLNKNDIELILTVAKG